MKNEKGKLGFENLPSCAVEYIKLIIKKMKWRKKVREDVQAELIAHFEDALRNCKTNEEKEMAAKELIANFGDAELIATLARRAKKRCRPMWQKAIIRCFQGTGIIIVCFILYCFYISSGKPTLRVNYTQEYINANRPTADSNANASVLYSKMAKIYIKPPKLSTERKSVNNDCGNDSSDLISRLYNIHSLSELNDEEFAAANKWIDDNNETIKLFIEASKKPSCWYESGKKPEDKDFFITMQLPNLASSRRTVNLLITKTRLEAYKGNLDSSLQDMFAIWDSADHFWGPRTIVEQLVGISVEAVSFKTTRDLLTEYNFSSEQLKLAQNRLEKLFKDNQCYMDYQTERFFKDDFVQRCFTDNGYGNGHPIPSKLSEFWGDLGEYSVLTDEHFRKLAFLGMAIVSADRKEITQVFNDFYDIAQQYAKTTPWQLRQESKSLDTFPQNWSHLKRIRYMNVMQLLPAFDRANLMFHRFNIDGKSLVLTLSVLRYQQDTKKLPESLQELKDAGYISEIPIDPFSGKEIAYKLTQDGFTIYSFGEDFEDDGGKIEIFRDNNILWNPKDDAVFWPVGR